MKPELLHILQHSLGVDQYGQGQQYRNHFVTGNDSDDFPLCAELVRRGLMDYHGPRQIVGGMRLFTVNEAGRKAMAECSPKPPKISRGRQRYHDFLRADCGMKFIEWLKARGSRT